MLNEHNSKKLMWFKKILWGVTVGGLMIPGYLTLMSVVAIMYLGNDFMVDFVGYKLSKGDVHGFIELLNMLLASALAGGVFGGVCTVLESYFLSRRVQSSPNRIS